MIILWLFINSMLERDFYEILIHLSSANYLSASLNSSYKFLEWFEFHKMYHESSTTREEFLISTKQIETNTRFINGFNDGSLWLDRKHLWITRYSKMIMKLLKKKIENRYWRSNLLMQVYVKCKKNRWICPVWRIIEFDPELNRNKMSWGLSLLHKTIGIERDIK